MGANIQFNFGFQIFYFEGFYFVADRFEKVSYVVYGLPEFMEISVMYFTKINHSYPMGSVEPTLSRTLSRTKFEFDIVRDKVRDKGKYNWAQNGQKS